MTNRLGFQKMKERGKEDGGGRKNAGATRDFGGARESESKKEEKMYECMNRYIGSPPAALSGK